MRRTYKMELKFEAPNGESMESIETILREAANRLLFTASLISGSRKPKISIICDDIFEGVSELRLERLADE